MLSYLLIFRRNTFVSLFVSPQEEYQSQKGHQKGTQDREGPRREGDPGKKGPRKKGDPEKKGPKKKGDPR